MKFEFDNNIPIYIQLIDKLKIYIIAGYLKPGDKLPSVREFASLTKVNPNTVQKAMMELEELNLIYTERTNGKFVTTDQKLIDKYRKEEALIISKQYITDMKNIGFKKEEIISYLKNLGGF